MLIIHIGNSVVVTRASVPAAMLKFQKSLNGLLPVKCLDVEVSKGNPFCIWDLIQRRAFPDCRESFLRKWGFRRKIVLRMYTAHSNVQFYRLLTLCKKYNRTKLNRIRRIACAGATGAIWPNFVGKITLLAYAVGKEDVIVH